MRKGDEDARAYRAFCEHGKVRALMSDPLNENPPNEAFAEDAYKELAGWARKGVRFDFVPIIEARKSDFACDICDVTPMPETLFDDEPKD